MKRFGSSMAALLIVPGQGELNADPFPSRGPVVFECRFDTSETEGWHPEPWETRFYWNRVTGLAGPEGDREGMREVEGFALRSGDQYAAHFVPAPITEATRYDPRFSFGLLSIREDGSAVMTEHSIVYGGMTALTQSGECDIQASDEAN